MIGYETLQELTSDGCLSSLPPGDDAAANRAWWAARGVDYDGLVRFFIEDGIDTLENVVRHEYGVPLDVMVASIASMSTEVGFRLGWLASERRRP